MLSMKSNRKIKTLEQTTLRK
ncbi:hypothetical protein F383_33361 [Gossypium arboreum]|uniref:Uncharacterized protein n=1 Tax=Gossypium arboreum TaxID=29729 RepID=A0A0B0MWR2_GOSAR|nr:hypothetical protein F383_33361 [Gossypium arboreum]